MNVFKNIAVATVVFSGIVCAKQLVDAVQKKESADTILHNSAQKLHTKIQSTLNQIPVAKAQNKMVVAYASDSQEKQATVEQHETFTIDDACDHCQKLFTTEVIL